MRHITLLLTMISLITLSGCYNPASYPDVSTLPENTSETAATTMNHLQTGNQDRPSLEVSITPDSASRNKMDEQSSDIIDKLQTQSAAQSLQFKSYSQMQRSINQNLNIAQLWRKYPSIFKFRGSDQTVHGKQIALTFDDVPDNKITPVILDILKSHGIQATFFIEGHRAKAYPEMVKRIAAEGHVIGNHSYDHPLLTKISTGTFIQQLRTTESILTELGGYKPRYFRPPFGEITEEQLQWAGDHGYIVVNWDVDSNDWRGISSAKVERNILSNVSSGSIILQHAGGGGRSGYLQNTVQALPRIIRHLRNEDYSFVTLPALLEDRKDKREY